MRSLQKLAAWYLQRSVTGHTQGASPSNIRHWVMIYGCNWQIVSVVYPDDKRDQA